MNDRNSLESAPQSCLIVGAGPAGTSAGILLAKQGWKVTLVDRRARIEQKICGECLSPPSRGLLQKLGVWARIAAADVNDLIGITLVGPKGGECFLDFGEDRPFTISRPVLDQALLDEAIASGVEVHFGITVTQLKRQGSRFLVEGNSGQFKKVFEFVLGADGRHSWVAKQLKLARNEKQRLSHAAVMSHFSQPQKKVLGVEMHVAPWGYVGINPLPHGAINAIVVLSPKLLKERLLGQGQSGLLPFLQDHICGSQAPRTLRERMEGSILISEKTWTVSPIAWLPNHLIGEKCVLIGDSAGFVDPFTGEGIYHALASTDFLCHQILTHGLQKGLVRYEKWHKETFGPEELFCFWLQRLLPFSRISDYVIRQLGMKPQLSHILAESVADRLPTRKVLSPWFWGKVLWPN